MPAKIRKDLVDPTRVGFYHCETRCVRRAAFYGNGLGGLDVSHRRRWARDRFRDLASVFAVEVLDYGILDNSLQCLLKIRPDVAAQWNDEDIARRWCKLNRQQLALNDVPPSQEQLDKFLQDRHLIKDWRDRLSSLSWFMIMLKEPLSRAANREEGVSGHFFGERFGCRECRTPEEIIQASVFSNGSSVVAGLNDSPEETQFTSYRDRLDDRRAVLAFCESWMRERGLDPDAGSMLSEQESGLVSELTSELDERLSRKLASVSAEELAAAVSDSRLERRADWLTPLHKDGDGFDEVSRGKRVSNEGFSTLGLDQYGRLLAACCEGARRRAATLNEERFNDERLNDKGMKSMTGGGSGGDGVGVGGGDGVRCDEEPDAASEVAQAFLPQEMPEMLEEFGYSREGWAEARKKNSRRFAWITRTTAALRRDYRAIASRLS